MNLRKRWLPIFHVIIILDNYIEKFLNETE